MTDPIQFSDGVQRIDIPRQSSPLGKDGAVAGKDFKSILLDSLDEVNRLQTEADKGVERLLTGESNNVAEVLAAAEKAGIAFDLLMEVRNKLTDAYREIQQIRI